METYIVRVNGVEYEVEVEQKGASSAPAAPKAAAPAAPKAAAPAKAAGTAVTTGTAGKVWKKVASEGQAVSKGDEIVILEAMKMEIPVVSPVDGVVNQILVNEGDSVESGQEIAIVG